MTELSYTSVSAEEEDHSGSALLSPQDEGSSKTEKLLEQYFPDPHKEDHPINKSFSDFMLVVIVLQTIVLGLQIQFTAEDYAVLGYVYPVCNLFFLAAYLIEVVLKMVWAYAVPVHMHKHLAKTFEVIRTVVGVRVLRILRRVRELTIVLGGVTGSFGTLQWIFLLLALLVYAFGIFFTVALGSDADLFEDPKFGTLIGSMITLTDMVMGGTWGEVINPIIEQRIFMLPFFFLFITVASFGLLNLVVGVICDATSDTRKRLEFETNRNKLRMISEQYRKRLRSLHLDMQSLAGSDRVSLQEKQKKRKEAIIDQLHHIIHDPARPVEFPAGSEAKDIYEMLDPEGKNTLNHEDFTKIMGRLLLGNSFQLTCMSLVSQGRTRRILRNQEGRRDAKFDNVDARFDKLEHRLDKFEDRFGNIEQQLATLVAKLK